jgi:hypothetical protein
VVAAFVAAHLAGEQIDQIRQRPLKVLTSAQEMALEFLVSDIVARDQVRGAPVFT